MLAEEWQECYHKRKERQRIRTKSMKRIKELIKREMVLCIALLLAVISSMVVLPDVQYAEYIDFHTLAILFCLMGVMAGMQKLGVFELIARRLLCRVRSSGWLVIILVMLCFFFSMLITNDVALITFVPFTFTVLSLLGEEQKERLILPVTVLQTVAANLGSMLTPVGNPQNLYLYGKSGLSLGEFIRLMFPYTLGALVMLLVSCLIFSLVGADKGKRTLEIHLSGNVSMAGREKKFLLYLLLFLLSMLTVAHLLPVWIPFVAVLTVLLIFDRELLGRIDYSLLLTFVGFFIFIGNMKRIPEFSAFLQEIVRGNETVTAIIASQVISNVPAALLLSGFTEDISSLIIGTNLGGLGTLIASMASLISYKYIAGENVQKGRYMLYFTAINIVFLLILLLLYFIL